MRNCTTVLALFAAFSLALFGTTANAGVVYQDNFDNDGLATNTGIGGGLFAYDRQGGAWLDNGDLDSNRNGNNDRGNVLSLNTFDLTGGFKLEVTHTIDNVTTIDANRAIIGLIDANSVPATQNNTTYITDFLNRNLDKYGIGMNLTIQNSTQGLNVADDAGAGTLNQLSNSQTISTGSQSWVLEVDAVGNWSYSIDGAPATTGASSFDVGRDYHFVTYMQDNHNHLKINSVTLTTAPSTPTPPSDGALVYESFSYDAGLGELHGKVADAGLGAWNVNPTGSGAVTHLGNTYTVPCCGNPLHTSSDMYGGGAYTDTDGNTLPRIGNYYETVAGFNDLARASIDTAAWSDDNTDGGKLNAKGAEIWFSAMMNANTITHNHFHLDFTDSDNGNASWANGPGYFAIGKTTGNNNWEILADNDDGDADVQAFSTAAVGTDTFILGRFLTDATTGDTTFDAWFDPLLDTAPGAAGTGDVSITLDANNDGSVTQFDTLGYRHQKWESPNLLDEIRMGETFNSVVGRADTSAVPEPSTFALAALGLLGLLYRGRRRKR